MFCQKCGMKAESGYRFCQRCGVPLDSSINRSKTESAVPKVQPEEKLPLWKRLLGGKHPSCWVSVLMIIGGVIVGGIGYSLVDKRKEVNSGTDNGLQISRVRIQSELLP